MLLGTYKHNIDDKGRISVPAKFRADIGEKAVVTQGLDGCLFLFPKHEWERLEAAFRTLSFKRSYKLIRYFCAWAQEVDLDSQGRISIPANLRELADLQGASMMIGAANRIEIWNLENWQNESAGIGQDDIIDLLDEINF